jgi:SAM-dependent methyltransferase
MFFLRKSSLERLPVAMSGVRMGERALQLGVDDPSLVGAIAAKVGLSGHAAVAVRNESEADGEKAGVLIEIQMQSGPTLPFESDSFDVIVLHASPRQASQVAEAERPLVLKEAHRVLRAGGRLVVVEGGSGSRAIPFLRSKPAFSDPATVIQTLNTAGFRAARILAEQEGYRFSEGLK